MSNITKCANTECPLAERCYRRTAIPHPHYQSWAEFKPTATRLSETETQFTCVNFLNNGKQEQI